MNSEQILSAVREVIEEKNGKNPVALNLQNVSIVADYFVICHGNSETQVKTIATELKKQVESLGIDVNRMEGLHQARWVLLDLGEVIVHIFHREDREYYHLERLWSDAKVVENV